MNCQLCLGTLFSLLATACSCLDAEQRPNIVIVIADDVSWDDFGCTGNPDVQTPNIDRLASEGIRFNSVYLTTSSCSPTRNSIMLGRYPHNTGAAELHTEPPDELVSLPEVLKEAGYYCAAAGKYHMGEGVKRGLDAVYDAGHNGGEGRWTEALQARDKSKPFFMWFAALDAHRAWGQNEFSGTHDPEKISPMFYFADMPGTRKELAAYYDEIKRLDHYVGLVVDELKGQGVYSNTLILVMADNGRPFPHGKTRLNDRGVKTPFIAHWPQQLREKPVESDALLSVIDIAPTLLELAGVEAIESMQGHSFVQLLKEPKSTFRNHVFAEHNWHDYEAHERMVRNKDFMYIRNSRPNRPQLGPADSVGSPSHADLVTLKHAGKLNAVQADLFATPRAHEELYDLRKDPRQWLNVASMPEYQETLQQMRATLDRWSKQTGDTVPDQLTKDWYEPIPGYIKTKDHGQRGEMPGAARNATTITHKGPF